MMYGGNWSVGAWIMMGVGMLIFWGLLIALLVAAVRLMTSRQESSASAQTQLSAGEILDQRFARGEIDEDEYSRRQKVLSGSS